MMLGDSSSNLLGSSTGDANAVAAAAAIGGGGAGGGGGGSNNSASEEDNNNKLGGRNDDGDRSFGGNNRWPRQETLALLKIRSDMAHVFRDSSLKGPLWEDVSRKLAELGYNRSAKKCKEKFENVYKYHKRTKDGRTGKPEGKHYKYFEQLEALDHHHHHHHHSAPQPKPQQGPSLMEATITTTQAIPWTMNNAPSSVVPHHINMVITSSAATPINAVHHQATAIITPPSSNPTVIISGAAQPFVQPLNNNNNNNNNQPYSFANVPANLFSSSTSSSTASEEYSEEQPGRGTTRRRKRKWKMFFERLTKQVIKKQEELQDKFLDEIDRRERERAVREESWRIQEMARMNRDHEILIQERSIAAAKDSAVIAFLQNISGQQQQIPVNENPQPPPQPTAVAAATKAPEIGSCTPNKPVVSNSYGETVAVSSSSSSRWPKAEVEALIKFRTELANKYQENGPKGPLWEEISAAMRSVGYNRNAKRCKEKWENINKYFKKVKESNKKRPDDSKTCPYFDQLDVLYKEKKGNKIISENNYSAGYYGNMKAVNHNNMAPPLMVQPEQQWPQNQPPMLNADQILEDDDEEDGRDSDEEDYEEDQEGNNGGYEIVPNKAAAATTTASMGNAE